MKGKIKYSFIGIPLNGAYLVTRPKLKANTKEPEDLKKEELFRNAEASVFNLFLVQKPFPTNILRGGETFRRCHTLVLMNHELIYKIFTGTW